jgi:pimeloyl-ACP methyl ester carboxylesterase
MVEQHAVTIGDLRMSREVTGDPAAPPMVLLHALGERAGNWAPVTPAFAGAGPAVVRAAVRPGGTGPTICLRGQGSRWPGQIARKGRHALRRLARGVGHGSRGTCGDEAARLRLPGLPWQTPRD